MTCQAITKKGTNCTFKAKENGFCIRHKNYLSQSSIKREKCKGKTKKGLGCKSFAYKNGYCKRHFKEETNIQCSICLDIIKDDSKTILNCSHCFHTSCLFENISKFRNNCDKCPMCRNQIDLNIENMKMEINNFTKENNSLKYKLELIKDELQDFILDDKINEYTKKRIYRDIINMI